jgi:hypothetical protein
MGTIVSLYFITSPGEAWSRSELSTSLLHPTTPTESTAVAVKIKDMHQTTREELFLKKLVVIGNN